MCKTLCQICCEINSRLDLISNQAQTQNFKLDKNQTNLEKCKIFFGIRSKVAEMASTKVQRIMTQPINLIFRFLQSKARIQIWLFEQKDVRIEGRIIGFDEYMNLVLDDAEEVNVKKKSRKQLGRILLKGDNITLMMNTGK
ncbi:hypothetical protein ACJIZ3_021065 [Penstemon smallii]|uniref:Small nuclear ribonucleoprotein E n=2 Tax=lamiids TaxID=91888 RepID=A0ABD3SKD8_9LAMI